MRLRVTALLLAIASALLVVVPTGSAGAAAASWSHCGPSRLMLDEPTALVTAVGTSCKTALDVEFWYDAPVRTTTSRGFHCPNRAQKWGLVCTKGAAKVVISWLWEYGHGNDCANGQIATGQGIEEVLGLSCDQGKKVIQQLVDGKKPSFALACKVTPQGDATCTSKNGKKALIGSAYTG